MNLNNFQLSQILDNTKLVRVLHEAEKIYSSWYREERFEKIRKSYQLTYLLFNGKFPGYKSCNTEYHDFYHTIDAFVAVLRLIDGYNFSEGIMSEETARELILASLLHDTGYIQEKGDDDGTGAKYTKNHVERSIEFIKKNKDFYGLSEGEIRRMGYYISSTGLNVKWDEIPFENEEQKIAGAMMGTADLLGQMADRRYLEKLLFLYYEFKEAGIPGYETEFDILRKTLDFYKVTMERLDKTLMQVYKYAEKHFDRRYNLPYNLYLIAIERHIEYIKKIIDDHTTNFRKKLRRMDLESIEKKYKSAHIYPH